MTESASWALFSAKDRFKDARREATKAFANTALTTSDRLLAMQYRVMATILETVDNPTRSLAACRVCIEELNSLPVVQQSFKVEFEKGLKAKFSKDKRREIVSTVCHINRVTYNVTLMVNFGNKGLSNWPCVDSGGKEVHPLDDERVFKVLKKQGMEHCFGTLELLRGHYGSLVWPVSIASNSLGQFIVTNDAGDKRVKVFDSRDRLLNCFALTPENSHDDIYTVLCMSSSH